MHPVYRFVCVSLVVGCSIEPSPESSSDRRGGANGGADNGPVAAKPNDVLVTGDAGTGGATVNGEAGTTPPPGPRPPVDTSCNLANAAFCDAFANASPGGRAGALDDAKWSVARLGSGGGITFGFPQTPLNVCGTWQTVDPSGPDSQFCVTDKNDPRWTEGFADNGAFNYLSARVRQPFDFAGRTGTIQFEADARNSGSHGWWIEAWITDEPVPGPNIHNGDQLVTSKNAIGIVMSLNCGAASVPNATVGGGKMGIERIVRIRDYQFQDFYDPFSGPNANARCVNTEQGELNKFQIKMSGNRVEVWASNIGSTTLERIAEADVDVGFTRGYVHLSHVHYNAEKAGVTFFQSYQWARVAFDGPQLATPRAYEIPDSMSMETVSGAHNPQVYRISYGVTDDVAFDFADSSKPKKLELANVDPTGGIGARLTFNTTFVAAGDTLRYRLNGKTWHTYQVPAIHTTWERQGFSVPVPIGDVVMGTNTLEIGTNSKPFAMVANSMQIANIDFEIDMP